MRADPRISNRESEVLDAVGEHLSNAEIADRLFISVRTVESHVSTLLRKLDVDDRRALARVAAARANAAAPKTNLPYALTSFVGRESERASILAALEDARLVTLNGTGGVGKTRLALEVGRALVSAGAPGVWFVDLAGVTDDHGVVPEILAAFEAREEPGRRPIDMLVDVLDRRPSVVILDNCEHLIESVSDAATRLLSRTSQLRLLLTSREATGLVGERILTVAPFGVPGGAGGGLEAVAANDGVRLFVDRARAVDPQFVLDAERAEAVASIVRHLDGLPLALELAAAQVVALSPGQIDARLRDRFSLLAGRAADPRHGTLQAMLDWSYQLLRADERAMLDRVAVFRGSFTLGAIESVVATEPIRSEDVGPLLTSLVRKSLVTVVDGGVERRYRLLETVREFAWHRLEAAGELSAWRDRHLAWMFELASRAADELHGPDQPAWLDRLDDDLDNLEAALAWSIEDAARAGLALPVVVGLFPYWLARGTRRSQGTRWSEATASAATGTDVSKRTRSLLSAVSLLMWSDLEAADALVPVMRQLEGDDPLARLHSDTAEAWLAGFRGREPRSVVQRAREVGADPRIILWMRGFDALHHAMSEPRATSHERLTDVAVAFRDAGDEHVAGACVAFAADCLEEADPERARDEARQALGIARRFECASCESGALASLVPVDECADLGGRVGAARRALELADGIGETANVYAALDVLSAAHAGEGNVELAALLGLGVAVARQRSGFAPILPGRERSRLTALEIAAARLGAAAIDELRAEAARLSHRDLVAIGIG